MDSKITGIFYLVDEFCKEFEQAKLGHILSEKTSVKTKKPQIYHVQQQSNHHRNPVSPVKVSLFKAFFTPCTFRNTFRETFLKL
jgi:hypothetical protein